MWTSVDAMAVSWFVMCTVGRAEDGGGAEDAATARCRGAPEVPGQPRARAQHRRPWSVWATVAPRHIHSSHTVILASLFLPVLPKSIQLTAVIHSLAITETGSSAILALLFQLVRCIFVCVYSLVHSKINKAVFSYLSTLTTWLCPHSHAAAAATSRYLLPAGFTAANLQQRVCCCGPMRRQTDGRTDGWTPYRMIDPAVYAGSGNKWKLTYGNAKTINDYFRGSDRVTGPLCVTVDLCV